MKKIIELAKKEVKKMYKIEVNEFVLKKIITILKQYIKSVDYITENRISQYTQEEIEKMIYTRDELQLFIDKIEKNPF